MVLRESEGPGAPPVLTSLLPDPTIHPTISWGGCSGLLTHESCWSVGTFSSSMEEQSVARDGPCKGGWSVGRMGNRAWYSDV